MDAPFFNLFKIFMVHDRNSYDAANIRKKIGTNRISSILLIFVIRFIIPFVSVRHKKSESKNFFYFVRQ